MLLNPALKTKNFTCQKSSILSTIGFIFQKFKLMEISAKKIQTTITEMEFKEFEPRFKSATTRFKLSASLNLETFDTILSGTIHI